MRAPVKIGALGHGCVVSEGIDGDLRPVFGNHAGGVAGLGEDRDRAHGQVFGGVSDGFANGFGDRKTVPITAAPGQRELSHVALGLDNDARHHGYRLAGIAAAGGFRREHDRIGAIEDGIGHVAGLGTCGARVLDH